MGCGLWGGGEGLESGLMSLGSHGMLEGGRFPGKLAKLDAKTVESLDEQGVREGCRLRRLGRRDCVPRYAPLIQNLPAWVSYLSWSWCIPRGGSAKNVCVTLRMVPGWMIGEFDTWCYKIASLIPSFLPLILPKAASILQRSQQTIDITI